MRVAALLLAVGLALAACVAPAPAQGPNQNPPPPPAPPAPPPIQAPAPTLVAVDPIAIPVAPFAGATSQWPVPPSPTPTLGTAPATLAPRCGGAFVQGGLAVCRTRPGAIIELGGVPKGQADAQGVVVIGFDRDAPARETLTVRKGADIATASFDIAPRTFVETRIDGVPQNTVTPDAAARARIARDRVHINRGYSSRADVAGFLDGFVWPVEGRISSAWGARRIINGTPGRPHYGIDLAVPTGTPIRAPAGGVVTLGQPDLHQEGGLVMIDHGQGLITLYLHMSRIDVTEGQRIAQGAVIGAAGASGRATGPHVCWRMKWRDRYLDPSIAIYGLAEARRALAGG